MLFLFEVAGNTSATFIKSPINLALQITAETEHVHSMDISLDGKLLVYSLEKNGFCDLWIRSADPKIVLLPKQLTNDPSSEFFPAISPDSKRIAFVSTAHDVKGDIYVLELNDQGAKPFRLTGRETEDGSPCFSPDGNYLYFHQKKTVDGPFELCFLDIDTIRNNNASNVPKPEMIPLETDASFPAISPDGNKIAFVSFQNTPLGAIKIFDINTKELSTITDGRFIDFSPKWSKNGEWLLFSRISIDTDNDGTLSTNDNACILKKDMTDQNSIAIPLTSMTHASFRPIQVQSNLFFLSVKKGIQNCWRLPMEGEIPTLSPPIQQVNLARQISLRVPFDPYLTILGYYKVIDRNSIEKKFRANSAYEIVQLLNKINKNESALQMCQLINTHFSEINPIATLSTIQEIVLKAKLKLDHAYNSDAKKRHIARLSLDLKKAVKKASLPVVFRSIIENVRVMIEYGDTNDLFTSLKRLDTLLNPPTKNLHSFRKEMAEALLLKADIYRRIGKSKELFPILKRIITDFSDITNCATEAVQRILDRSIQRIRKNTSHQKILYLRQLSADNEQKIPLIAIGALIRIADIYYNSNEWEKAKSVYSEVIEKYRKFNYQTAPAKLALAEILYKEERFKKAIDLYEKEMDSRSYDDLIYRLARESYIRKSIDASEYQYRLGEIASALNTFNELILYDSTIVEAHRGYIKCKVALGKNAESLEKYSLLLKNNPNNPVYIYAKALCLTYLNTKSALKEAMALIKKSITVKGQIEYFHQTLGYVYEVLETVYHQTGNLELALESYKKAYFLNNHVSNPENYANLVINLGNSYFLLNQYHKAFEFYSLRNQSGRAFDNINTEIMFYRRFGASAFQIKAHEKTILAYQKAIDLINERVDPQYHPHPASVEMEKINRILVGKILTPILSMKPFKSDAKTYLKTQADINRDVSKISQIDQPPPSEKWFHYQAQMKKLVYRQKKQNTKIIKFLKYIHWHEFNPEQIEQELQAILIRVDEALNFPERFIHLKAEMTDRIALAYQEADRWDESEKAFEQTFHLNQSLKNFQNLAINMRQIGYTRYRSAEKQSGKAKREKLNKSLSAFVSALEFLEKYGVQTKEKNKTNALMDITLNIYLNKTDTSNASYGFSKKQEKRLCETFIARIRLELGNLKAAQADLKKQLEQYPLTKPVSPNDLYGVSLLYHRAGHLAYAMNENKNGIKYFTHSAKLAAELQNPVNMAFNVTNVAKLLSQLDAQNDFGKYYIKAFRELDTQTTNLLTKKTNVIAPSIDLNFHNAMGIYYVLLPDIYDSDIEKNVYGFQNLSRAVAHFQYGLDILKSETVKGLSPRKRLAYKSLFHLNLAKTASSIGDKKTARNNYQKALELSQKGLLPDYEWRAYAGIGEYEKAIESLKKVTIVRAHCGPSEIQDTFGGYIYRLVTEKKIEEAFNLSESIAEIERYHRMAFLLNDLFDTPLIKTIAPRILHIRELRKQLKNASKKDKLYIQEELEQEISLLENKTNPNNHKLPDIIRRINNKDIKELFIILCGLALNSESEAELIVEKRMKEKRLEKDTLSYDELVQRYQTLRSEAINNRSQDQACDAITYLGPEPFEAFDVMEYLGSNDTFVKLVRINSQEQTYILFEIHGETIDARTFSKNQVTEYIASNKSITYVAYDNLWGFDPFKEKAQVLSATHFIRSVLNRNSLKQILMGIPGDDITLSNYTLKTLDKKLNTFKQINDNTPEIFNSLLISNPLAKSYEIPTRSGEHGKEFIGLQLNSGTIQSILTIPIDFSNASLAILPGLLYQKDAYLLTHLLSISGMSSVIIPAHKNHTQTFVHRFFDHYLSMSAWDAKHIAQVETNENWILLGYKGMSQQEAANFAKQHFIKYVKRGQFELKNDHPLDALKMFECALQLVEEIPEGKRYFSNLYAYCRESAYRSGEMIKAQTFSKKLAALMASNKPDTFEHADALLKLGLLSAKIEKYDQAIDALEESLDIVSNLELEEKQIQVMNELGLVFEQATFYRKALETFESSLELSQSFDQNLLMAQQYENIGRIYDLRSSQYTLSIDSYQKALSIYEKMGKNKPFHSKIAQIKLNIGRCYRLLGNFEEAETSYKDSLALIDSHSNTQRLKSSILIEQANNAWFQGRYETAFRYQRACDHIARSEGFPLMQVVSLNTSGLIWWTLGDNAKALKELNKALTTAKKLNIRPDEIATTLNNLGIVKRKMKRYKEALSDFNKAIEIDTKIGSRWALAYDMRNKALTYLKMGEAEQSIPLFKKALEEASAIGNRINKAKALLGIADAYASIDSNREAEKYYQQAQTLSSEMCIRETQWRSIFGLAKLDLLQGNQQSAQKHLYEALTIIENIRAEIKIEQLKDSYIADKNKVYETLCKLLADQKKETESFSVAERSRSRNFIDLLGNQSLNLNNKVDQTFFERQKVIRTAIQTYETRLSHAKDKADRLAYQKTLSKLHDDYKDLMLDIQMKNPQLASFVSIEPIDIERLKQSIETDIALLSYYVLPDETLIWVIKKDGIKLFRKSIDRALLFQSILDYRRMIQNLEPLEDYSKALFNQLLSPVIESLKDIKIVGIIPHRFLHYLSFATLMGDVSSKSEGYLIDRFALFYLPNASMLEYSIRRRKTEKKFTVLAIGNPDLGDPVFDLPFAEFEVNSIQWNFSDITVLTRKKATEFWIKKNIEKFGIIHLASHGEFDPINPLFSSIKLTKDAQNETDGNLETQEVFGLNIQADMVVLSACQTGLGKITPGDDIIGLNRAFFYAGTHTLISSLWRVSDISTAILIKNFYRQYRHHNKAESLRQAIFHVKKNYPHPGYWGAFNLVGDYY